MNQERKQSPTLQTPNKNPRNPAARPLPREQSLGDAFRRLRVREGVSVRTLASKCGFSPSFISQFELDQVSPSLASLERIAAAIGVTLGEFLNTAERSDPEVVRSSRRPILQSGWSRSQIESLGNTGVGSRFEALLVTMHREGTSGSGLHTSEREFFVMVISGSVTLDLAEGTQVLRRGDAITIPAGTPHRWENRGTKDVKLLKVTLR